MQKLSLMCQIKKTLKVISLRKYSSLLLLQLLIHCAASAALLLAFTVPPAASTASIVYRRYRHREGFP